MGSAGNAPITGRAAAVIPVALLYAYQLPVVGWAMVVGFWANAPAAPLLEENLDDFVEATPIPDRSPTAPQPEGTQTPTFEEVVERHQAEIYRYALQLTRNRTDADDLYQETLLKAYRAFGRLDARPNHRAWLYRIATNTFLSDRRKLARVDPLDDATARAIPAAAVDHAAGLDARDVLREVAAFVAGLPPKQRLALTLRKYQELGYAEIAAALNSSQAAARGSVHEALRKLRARFGDRPTEVDVPLLECLPSRAGVNAPAGR